MQVAGQTKPRTTNAKLESDKANWKVVPGGFACLWFFRISDNFLFLLFSPAFAAFASKLLNDFWDTSLSVLAWVSLRRRETVKPLDYRKSTLRKSDTSDTRHPKLQTFKTKSRSVSGDTCLHRILSKECDLNFWDVSKLEDLQTTSQSVPQSDQSTLTWDHYSGGMSWRATWHFVDLQI